jgi:tetratricopeptide (TPR) repeat protein
VSELAPSCPSCNKPLPASIAKGPAQAVVRCDGCASLLLWSNGRVVRTAKSGTPTIAGMPAVKPPPPAPAPAPPATPPRQPKQTQMGMAAVKQPPAQPAAAPPAGAKPAAAKPAAAKPAAAKPTPPKGASPSAPIKLQPVAGQPKAEADDEEVTRTAGVDPPLLDLQPEEESKPKPPPTPPTARITPKKDNSERIEVKPPALPSAPPPKPIDPKKDQSQRIAVPATTPPRVEMRKEASSRVDLRAQGTKKDAPQVVVAGAADAALKDAPGPIVNPQSWFPDPPAPAMNPIPAAADPGAPSPLPPPPGGLPPVSELTPGLGTALPKSRSQEDRETTPPFGTAMPAGTPDAQVEEPTIDRGMPSDNDELPPLEPEPTRNTAPPPRVPQATVRGFDSPARASDVAAAVEKEKAEKEKKRAEEERAAKAEKERADKERADKKRAEEERAAQKREEERAAKAEKERAAKADKERAEKERAAKAAAKRGADAPTLQAEVKPGETPAPLPPPAQPAPQPTRTSMDMMEPAALSRGGLTKQQKIIGGALGGALLLGVVLLLVLKSSPTVEPTKPPEPKVEAPKPPEPKVEAPKPPEPKVEAPKPPEPKPVVPPVEEPPSPGEPKVAHVPREPREPREPRQPPVETPAESFDPGKPKRLGGRKVVLDESRPAAVAPAPAVPAGEDPATVARAREAYLSGNTKLFIGDTDGAVTAYRRTLSIYPGYVAGYRGLGLAFEQQSNIEEALGAFKTYVKNVPNAKDIPLIRRRMELLEKKR